MNYQPQGFLAPDGPQMVVLKADDYGLGDSCFPG